MESLNNPNNLDRQHPNLIDTKKFGPAASLPGMAAAGTGDPIDVAIRCRVLTRLYAGDNSSLFANTIGISPTSWNGMEQSGALSKRAAFKIVKKWPEISLDWLWRGLDDGLTRPKSDELSAAFRSISNAHRAGKGTRRPS